MIKKLLQWHPAFQAILQIEFSEDADNLEFIKEYPGIYYVWGLIFPLQIVIADKLPPEDYIWLSRLRKNLRVHEDIQPLALAYKGKDKNPLYVAAMDFILRANRKQTKEGLQMCEALRELFEDELWEREERGLERGLERGKAESVLELLSELGTIPESLRDMILAQKNAVKLSAWLKLAAKAESVENFLSSMN